MTLETATFGGGCFWCIEAAFSHLRGVTRVTSGYAGGHTTRPDYKSVCSGQTGHAEVVQVQFNPEIISFSDILEIFFAAHDPTTLNRQGNDLGPQYRSIILYESEPQQIVASTAIETLRKEKPVVTQLVKLEKFYPAEDYHQDFYANNPNHGYCRVVIQPKLDSLTGKFSKYFAPPSGSNDD
jgi:methionine-S-sulfoxide reductase